MNHIFIKRGISIVLTLCAVLGWWGALYPQFTLLRGTYRIVYEDTSVQERTAETDSIEDTEPQIDSSELYWEILDADRSRIRLKSRLLTDWKTLQEAEE